MLFSKWALAVILLLDYWWVFALLGGVLVLLGLRSQGLARTLLLGGGGLLVVVPAGTALFAAVTTRMNKARQVREAREWQERQVVLREPRKTNGLMLPAGTVVRWKDEAAGTVWTAKLAGPGQINGLLLGQDLQLLSVTDSGWKGTLLSAALIDGKQCAPGPLRLTETGALRACVLAEATDWPFGTVPAGTTYDHSEGSGTMITTLSLGDLGVTMRGLSVTIPPRAEIQLYPDDRIQWVTSQLPVVVRGVKLVGVVGWLYSQDEATSAGRVPTRQATVIAFRGDLFESLHRGETILEANGMRVIVPATGGTVQWSRYDRERNETTEGSFDLP